MEKKYDLEKGLKELESAIKNRKKGCPCAFIGIESCNESDIQALIELAESYNCHARICGLMMCVTYPK